jgi:FtsP/CotA-like multicopper oxidase with cupredoxin domain
MKRSVAPTAAILRVGKKLILSHLFCLFFGTKLTVLKKLLLLSALSTFLITFHAFNNESMKTNFSPAKFNEADESIARLKRDIIACAPLPGKSSGRKMMHSSAFPGSLEEISLNDNREPAGVLKKGVLFLDLEVRSGLWYPETTIASPLQVFAFAEKAKPLQLPGPLIRVPEGTEIRAAIHNPLSIALVVRGFYTRPANHQDSITIAPGHSQTIHFKVGAPGTYYYWASAGNLKRKGRPFREDSQLYGALIIDPANKKPDKQERILMIGIWNDTLNGKYSTEKEELVLNGLTWPYTEQLTYRLGQVANWRVINTSNQVHPMHLHGFFYTVNSRGNENADTIYTYPFRRKAVTELLKPGETMSMTWVPEKEGNWLFHCHTLFHIMAGSFLAPMHEMTEDEKNDLSTHARMGMGGLIMGIHVLSNNKEQRKNSQPTIPEKKLSLVVKELPHYFDSLAGKGFVLIDETKSTGSANASIPGPPIILTRNEPTAIKIINKLSESTTIHWHGLEIESYFDGVSGWGNRGSQLAPLVKPGDSFTVHITPPRAGTFIYHTHMHSAQLFEGLYGPLIVLEQGQKFDPETDRILVMSDGMANPPDDAPIFINGTARPDTMKMKVGIKYKLRLINITAIDPDMVVSLLFNNKPINWRAVAKDGADLPAQQIEMKSAVQPITVGETRDFEFSPAEAGNYFFEVRAGDQLFVTLVVKVAG